MDFVRRIITAGESRATLADPEEWMFDAFGAPRSKSGERVSINTALSLVPVYAAVTLLAGTGGTLPLIVYKGQGRTRDRAPDTWQYELLHNEPNDEMAADVWIESLLGHDLLWGNFYAEKEKATEFGRTVVKGLWPIRPDKVRPDHDRRQRKVFEIQGVSRALTEKEIVHIPAFGYDGLRGMSPVSLFRESIGIGLARETYEADHYANNADPGGVIQLPPGKKLTAQAVERLRRSWESRHRGSGRRHGTGVLEDGATWQKIGLPLRDQQFIEAARFSVNQIARMFGVPPELIGGDRESSMTYATVEGQALNFLKFSLRRWLVRVEKGLKRDKDLFPEGLGLYPEFLVEGILRGDSVARAAFYTAMYQLGAYSSNDIRELENKPPREGGDQYVDPPAPGAADSGAARWAAIDAALKAVEQQRRRELEGGGNPVPPAPEGGGGEDGR